MEAGAPAAQVVLDGHPLLSLWGEDAGPTAALSVPDGPLTVSRFAWIRRQDGVWLAESALDSRRVALLDARAHRLLLSFGPARRADADAAAATGLPLSTVNEMVGLLLLARVLVDKDDARVEEEPPLAVWEFHDLLFHVRSRRGRSPAPFGGTYRFAQRFPIEPALPPPRGGRTVALERPDWDRLERGDPPLARVQSLRTSVREFGASPMALDELSEFLYRVARVEDYWGGGTDGSGTAGAASFVAKPYPSGGSLYELEFYVAVQRCGDLDAGLYHYLGDRHALEHVAEAGPELAQLLAVEAGGMGLPAEPVQVLIMLTARMGRIAWKYQSIAYSLVLKHVGVVLQTMYLSATAMGLGGCAIGTGDSDLFARASGIDYYAEAVVGEFALGSRP
jgi:SagB-type dehydrogenase family enzyme